MPERGNMQERIAETLVCWKIFSRHAHAHIRAPRAIVSVAVARSKYSGTVRAPNSLRLMRVFYDDAFGFSRLNTPHVMLKDIKS